MTSYRAITAFVCLLLCAMLSACAAPELSATGPSVSTTRLDGDYYVTGDGQRLRTSVWPAKSPRAVFVAVHGFNEYAGDFRLPAPWFTRYGISVYGYDQRGFGRTSKPRAGRWYGGDVMARDLARYVNLIRERHAGLPVFVLATSMGGAVTMKAAVDNDLQADGVILVAPAIWGWKSMNPILKSALWVTAHTVPASSASGSPVDIWPSDNIEWLREYSRDPHNIKGSRFDTLYGLVTLMDEAAAAAPAIKVPVLYLYGLKDEVVPADPSKQVMATLPPSARSIVYEKGYHMLLHDKQRETVYRDILQWIDDQPVTIPVSQRLR